MELHEACLVGTTHWATGQVWVSPYDPDTQGFWNECYYCGRMLPFLKKYNHRNIQIIYFCSLIFWPELLLQCKLWSPGYTSMQACCSRRCKNPSLEKEGQKEPWSVLVSVFISCGWESGAQIKHTGFWPWHISFSLHSGWFNLSLKGYQL